MTRSRNLRVALGFVAAGVVAVPAVASATSVATQGDCLVRDGRYSLVVKFTDVAWPIGSRIDEVAAHDHGAIFHSDTGRLTPAPPAGSDYSASQSHEVVFPLTGTPASVHGFGRIQAYLPGQAEAYREASFDQDFVCPPAPGIDTGIQVPPTPATPVTPTKPIKPRLTIFKDVSRWRVLSGGNVGWRIVVKNISKVTAYGAVVTDPLGQNLSLRLRPAGAEIRNGTVRWTIPVLKPGKSWVRWIRSRATLGDARRARVCNTVTVTLRHKPRRSEACVIVRKPPPKPGRTAG